MNWFNVDKEKIEFVIDKNLQYLENKKLCSCNTPPSIADYSDDLYQSVYTIKYFPAYYFEYCYFAYELNHFFSKKKQNLVNIISLGSGSCPDYYAFFDNLVDIDFCYVGVDCNCWNRELFPVVGDNFDTMITSAEDIKGLDDYHVISFPKSITNIFGNELNEDSQNKIEMFVDNLVSSGRNEIIFFISYEHIYAVGHFVFMSKALTSKGYEIIDSINSKNNADARWYIGSRPFIEELGYQLCQNLHAINNKFKHADTNCDDIFCLIRQNCTINHSSLKTCKLIRGNFFVFKRVTHDN